MAMWHCLLMMGLLLWLPISQTSESEEFGIDSLVYEADAMEKSIQDLFEEPLEEEGRLFNFDRRAAFNTSIAFTIPLFSFTLPGAQQTAETGLDSNSFGVLAFVALFLLGGLGVAIYTTSQGGNVDGVATVRKFKENDYFSNQLLSQVLDSISGLPEALDLDSCAKLSVCAAHAEPEHYGFLSWPLRLFIPARLDEVEDTVLTEYEKAAVFGAGKSDECYYEYPCLIQPLDALLYLKDYLLSSK